MCYIFFASRWRSYICIRCWLTKWKTLIPSCVYMHPCMGTWVPFGLMSSLCRYDEKRSRTMIGKSLLTLYSFDANTIVIWKIENTPTEAQNSYSWGARFESQPGHKHWSFSGFPHSLHGLHTCASFWIHQSWHWLLYNVATDVVIFALQLCDLLHCTVLSRIWLRVKGTDFQAALLKIFGLHEI
jgi:hypothetical protein